MNWLAGAERQDATCICGAPHSYPIGRIPPDPECSGTMASTLLCSPPLVPSGFFFFFFQLCPIFMFLSIFFSLVLSKVYHIVVVFAEAEAHFRLSKNENVYGTFGKTSLPPGNEWQLARQRRAGRDGRRKVYAASWPRGDSRQAVP